MSWRCYEVLRSAICRMSCQRAVFILSFYKVLKAASYFQSQPLLPDCAEAAKNGDAA